ncbi:MAG: GNAT family N-acetyltransferase [Candidatus Pristimantibacillus sp.]
MELHLLTPEQWMADRKRLLSFAVRFGEKRLTVSAIHTLRMLNPSLLSANKSNYDAVITVAKIGNRIVGLGFAADAGENSCFVVVNPETRGLGIGAAIVQSMINRLGRLSCHVATDNIPSMALCFRLGMNAVSMHTGPTGKPTLRFERRPTDDVASLGNLDVIS